MANLAQALFNNPVQTVFHGIAYQQCSRNHRTTDGDAQYQKQMLPAIINKAVSDESPAVHE